MSNEYIKNKVPLCPKCGSPMVLRTAKRGRYAGQEFWGCSRYPKCKGLVNIEEDVHTVTSESDITENNNKKSRYDIQEKITIAVIVGVGVAVLFAILSTCNFSGGVTIRSFSFIFMSAFVYSLAGLLYYGFLALIMVVASGIFDMRGKTRREYVLSNRFNFNHIPVSVAFISSGIMFVLQALGIIEPLIFLG